MMPDDEALRRAIAASLAILVDRRGRAGHPLGMLEEVRQDLNRAMVSAPMSGCPVSGIAVRARLAALFDEEIGKIETRLQAGEMPSDSDGG